MQLLSIYNTASAYVERPTRDIVIQEGHPISQSHSHNFTLWNAQPIYKGISQQTSSSHNLDSPPTTYLDFSAMTTATSVIFPPLNPPKSYGQLLIATTASSKASNST